MSMSTTIAILGGGSVWTPQLLWELSALPVAPSLHVRLFGRTETHVEAVSTFTRSRPMALGGLQVVRDLPNALADAGIIVNQVRIGGWSARVADETLPVQVGAVGDESLGLGGLRAALRTAAFIAEVSPLIRECCPRAWLLNLTNPCDLICRAWLAAGCRRVIGLCDNASKEATAQQAAWDSQTTAAFEYLGACHVGWISLRGVAAGSGNKGETRGQPWLTEWGALPTRWRARFTEAAACQRMQREAPACRAAALLDLVGALRACIESHAVAEYARLLQHRPPTWYTASLIPCIRAIAGGAPARLVVGLPNNGRLRRLGPDIQVECQAVVGKCGPRLEPITLGEQCQEDVARFGGTRDAAFAALANPGPGTTGAFAQCDPFTSFADLRGDWYRTVFSF
jgi:6-phospho-beta-glucosidase